MSHLINKPAIAGAAGTPGGSIVCPFSAEGTKRFTKSVGLVTAVVGGALVATPARVGPVMALKDPTATRLIGQTDLTLVPGLVVGRLQLPWLTGRAVLNLVNCQPSAHLGARIQGGTRITSQAFTSLLYQRGVRISMAGKGCWTDNVFSEHFWCSLKYEEVCFYAYNLHETALA